MTLTPRIGSSRDVKIACRAVLRARIGKPGLIGARAGAGYSTGSFWNQGGAVSSISEVYMLTSPTTYSYGDTIEVDGKEGVFAPFSNTTYKVCVRIK